MTIGRLFDHTPTGPREAVIKSELPAMFAALCSYEDMFGPYHPQTLRLMVEVGIACVEKEEVGPARCLLARASRDLCTTLGRDHEVRVRAIEALRDLFVRLAEWERAIDAQRELVECQTRRFGPDHLHTLAARADLEELAIHAP
jgi:hypothetical protein